MSKVADISKLLSAERWSLLTVEQRRSQLLDWEDMCTELRATDGVEIPVTHHHASGVYAREIFLPKGTFAVGEIHKHDHINTLSKGSIRVATEDGIQDLVAPCTFVSRAGVKRAGGAIEDTVWTVYHATESTDPEEIREEFIAEDYNELNLQIER